jgi:hypothetical protein
MAFHSGILDIKIRIHPENYRREIGGKRKS